MCMQNFIHLRNISSYSLCTGSLTIKNLIDLAIRHRIPALGLTERGNLFSSLEFALNATKAGLQPIIGIASKVKLTNNNLDDILIIAKNEQGYKNLIKVSSSIYLDNHDNNHAIDFKLLKKHHSDLIILIGYHQGEIYQLIKDNQFDQALLIIKEYLEIFTDNLYIEITRLNYPNQAKIESKLLEFAFNLNIPIVATNDIKFADHASYEAQQILQCIARNKYYDDPNLVKDSPEHYFKSPSEMIKLFQDLPEAIENTVNISKRCSYYPTPSAPSLPHFTTTADRTENEELTFQAEEGLAKKIANFDDEKKGIYQKRLVYELKIINNMGFPGYFLIVSDFIKWSKKQNIPVGPGRGSGAGSIVAWCLAITDLDPIKYGLLFERFLNPERVSMPDFDIDFCQERREEVVKYVQDKYGVKKVAQIITFGKLQAKAVLKDVGRVLQIPYGQIDKICKMIPFNPVNPVSLAEAIKMDVNLQKERDDDRQIAKLLNIGLKLEGLHRHASTHAAGVVISNQDLLENIALYQDPRSTMPVVQYSMKYTELSGLVKFDFLGLKTLTTISKTIEILNLQNINLDIEQIAEDDKASFELLSSGTTIGVFQLESAGMRECLKNLRPDKIEDLIALISLYRPGPMDNIPTYIACKHGEESVKYPHPLLEDCLKETFGVIIYQEQVMQIAQILASYSLGQADLLRRAMGKKIKAEMDAQQSIFVKGCLKNNITENKAKDIFALVAKFAGYGFNKSHAAAYAKIGYQTAYLKAHYPTEFITATLNLDIHDTDKISLFIQEAKDLNINILPPNINYSDGLFKVQKLKNGQKAIRYGLAALKSVSLKSIQELEEIRRNKKQNFNSIKDLLKSTGSKILQKRQLESLIKSGSLDDLEKNRAKLLNSLEIIIKHAQFFENEKLSNQQSLFGQDNNEDNINLAEFEDFQLKEKLQNEFEAVGFYLTQHPLDNLKNILKENNTSSSYDINMCKSATYSFLYAGVILNYKQRSGKNGRFVTLNISDTKGVLDISIFDDELISHIRELIYNGSLVVINANLRNDANGSRIMVSNLVSIDDFLKQNIQTIEVNTNNINEVKNIKLILNKNPGILPIKLIVKYHVKDNSFYIDTRETFYTDTDIHKKLIKS